MDYGLGRMVSVRFLFCLFTKLARWPGQGLGQQDWLNKTEPTTLGQQDRINKDRLSKDRLSMDWLNKDWTDKDWINGRVSN